MRLSRRLKESAACLVAEEGDHGGQHGTPAAEDGAGRTWAAPARRILELNPDHPAVQGLRKLHQADPADPRVADYVRLLHDQAVLAEGSRIPDPGAFARRINDLIAKDAERA